MMKKWMIACLTLLLLVGCSKEDTTEHTEKITDVPKTAEFTFDYNPQDGSGSNQYALWIEDENGEYIKTIYVTKFAGGGGYRVKTDTLPIWTEAIRDNNVKQEDVDAVTSVTPVMEGTQTYVWDRKTQEGLYVDKGTYYYFLEANLRDDVTVLYTGQITIGDEVDESYAVPQYFGSDDPAEKNMIEHVKAVYEPAR